MNNINKKIIFGILPTHMVKEREKSTKIDYSKFDITPDNLNLVKGVPEATFRMLVKGIEIGVIKKVKRRERFALLNYFFDSEARLSDIGEMMGGIRAASVRRLIVRGLGLLHKEIGKSLDLDQEALERKYPPEEVVKLKERGWIATGRKKNKEFGNVRVLKRKIDEADLDLWESATANNEEILKVIIKKGIMTEEQINNVRKIFDSRRTRSVSEALLQDFSVAVAKTTFYI